MRDQRRRNILSHYDLFVPSGLIVAISTFTGGSRTTGPTGGDYFIGFITILIAAGWVIAALGDFFILTKVTLGHFLPFAVSL